MATNQKFLFENDFAHPDEMRKRAAVHTDDDLAQARAEGIAQGRTDVCLIAREQAVSELTIGGESESVAGRAERSRDTRDDAHGLGATVYVELLRRR